MKKILCLLALSMGTTSADSFAAGPLKDVVICPLEGSFTGLTDLPKFLPTAFSTRLEEKILTKARAYRMLGTPEECAKFLTNKVAYLYLNVVLTNPTSYDYKGFALELEVFKVGVDNYAGALTLWKSLSAGISRTSASELEEYITTAFSNQLDKLAADYALANP